MFLRYALRGEQLKEGSYPLPRDFTYHEVPEEVALADDNGCWGVFLSETEQVGVWHMFINRYNDFEKEARKSLEPLKDADGNLLAIGDIVVFGQGVNESHIGRITRFTSQRVSIYSLTINSPHSSAYAKDVVGVRKIHNSLW